MGYGFLAGGAPRAKYNLVYMPNTPALSLAIPSPDLRPALLELTLWLNQPQTARQARADLFYPAAFQLNSSFIHLEESP